MAGKKIDQSKKKSISPVSSIDWRTDLLNKLKDPGYAGGYLAACIVEGEDCFDMGVLLVKAACWGRKKTGRRPRG